MLDSLPSLCYLLLMETRPTNTTDETRTDGGYVVDQIDAVQYWTMLLGDRGERDAVVEFDLTDRDGVEAFIFGCEEWAIQQFMQKLRT